MFYYVLLGFTRFSRILQRFYCVILDFYSFLLGLIEFYWLFLGSNGTSVVAISLLSVVWLRTRF